MLLTGCPDHPLRGIGEGRVLRHDRDDDKLDMRMSVTDTVDVQVIGGGQAGLAAGYHLQRAGMSLLILEAGPEPVGSWPAYYDSLTLFSPARYSSLPGLPFPGDRERYPARDDVVDYLRSYAQHFELPIQTRARVDAVDRTGELFRATASDGREFARER